MFSINTVGVETGLCGRKTKLFNVCGSYNLPFLNSVANLLACRNSSTVSSRKEGWEKTVFMPRTCLSYLRLIFGML